MAIRKAITKKTRFEVFKRDSFKCQYCGKSAPEVILHVDHMHPVSKGGDNDITNLITACFDCNMGKKHRLLDDNSVIEKQKQQLDELNEKRNQLQMLMKWRKELKNIDAETEQIAIEAFNELIGGKTLNEAGEAYIKKALKKFGLNEVLNAIDIASKYIDMNLDEQAILSRINKALSSITGICNNLRQPKHLQEINYIVGICANRFAYCNRWQLKSALLQAYGLGISVEAMKEAAFNCRNWSQYVQWINNSKEAIYG